MGAASRFPALVLSLLLLGSAAGAGSVGAPSGLPALPRYPAVPAAWTASFDRLGLPFPSAESRAPLAQALSARGLEPGALEALGPAERAKALGAARSALRETLEPWALAASAAASRLDPASLSREELASAEADLRYLAETLGPYLTPGAQALARHAHEPFLRAVQDGERARLGALAEARARALAPDRDDAGGVAGGPGSGRGPLLGPALDRATAQRVAAFSDRVQSLFQGRAPLLVADMDGSLTAERRPLDRELTRSAAGLLRAGGRLAVLTGSSVEAVHKQVLAPLLAELRGEEEALRRLTIAARNGAETYRYDAASRRLERTRGVDLEGVMIAHGFKDGPARVRGILEEAAARFDFEGTMRALLGKGVQGPLVVEDRGAPPGPALLTRITLVPTGESLAERDKRAYDAAGGRELRLQYAAFINDRLREEGLPLEARLGGKTSIVVGIDKGFGLRAVAQELHAEPASLVWAGDDHRAQGSDAPAARQAGAVIDLGKAAPGGLPRAFREEGAGPRGLRPYLDALAAYAASRGGAQ